MVDTVVDLALDAAVTAGDLIQTYPLTFVIGFVLLAGWAYSMNPRMSGR